MTSETAQSASPASSMPAAEAGSSSSATTASGSSESVPAGAPPASYFNSINNLAPTGFLNFLHDLEDNEAEQIEHFKYKQELERKLTVTSIIGLGFSLMGVPFGISSTLWITLVDGGNVTMLYGWLIVTFFSLCVVLSLSEIISKYPTAGGVYHFSALLSNEKYSLIASWFTGWFLIIGSWTYLVSILFAGSQFILSILGIKDSYYKEDIFLVLALYLALLAFCGFINYRFPKQLDKINKACIYWSIYTILAIDFLLIFFAKRTHSIKEIFTTFDNSRSGWPAPLAFLVGLSGSSFTMTGYGMLFSMTDEVKNPERNMPKGAISAILITSVNGLIFILPILTILPELTLLLDKTPEIMPIDLIFKFSLESYIITFLLICLLIGTVIFQGIGSLTTASRTTYAFARDGGLPYKEKWTEVDSVEESKMPKNALFLTLGMCAVLPFIAIISESAFNSFMSSSVVTLALANGVPILCLMLNKRRKIRGAAFKLRYVGWVINFLSVFWVALSSVVLCLPPVIKGLTWRRMNYAIAVILVFVGLAAIGYRVWGHKSFEGPKIDTDYFELHNVDGQQLQSHEYDDTAEFEAPDELVSGDEETFVASRRSSESNNDDRRTHTDEVTIEGSEDSKKKGEVLFQVS